MFSAVSRPSFSTLAFSDLVEPTMAGVSKQLGDSEDLRSYSSTRFESSIVRKIDEFTKARMLHKF